MRSTRTQQRLTDVGLLAIRLVLAAVFVYHGGQKLFGLFGGHGLQATAGYMGSAGLPWPMLSAILAGSAEFFGGLVLVLGSGARIAAVPMAFAMAVAVFHVHLSRGFGAAGGGVEYPLTLGVVLVSLVLMGPGSFTIGRLVAAGRSATTAEHLRTTVGTP